jgi:cytochrome c553
MQHHFADVMLIHEAVIRGDLPSVRQPALRLTTASMPPGVPEAAAPFVANIRKAGQRAADATALAAAAQATVAMVTECANCHRAVGVSPAPSLTVRHDVGGVVGHMEEHQRAADDMLVGLMIPSTSQWLGGAERLRVATLLPSTFPKDPKLTKEIRQLDIRVHEMADRAIDAETATERAHAYTDLLTTCAQCHRLHSSVWGPGRGLEPPRAR